MVGVSIEAGMVVGTWVIVIEGVGVVLDTDEDGEVVGAVDVV